MALVNEGFLHYSDMKNFLKNLLWNRWSDFKIILQKCSLGDPFQRLFAKFWSVYKHGYGEWGLFAWYRLEEILKNLLWNYWSDFKKLFHRNVPWVTLFKNCWQNFDLSINMVLVNGGYLYGHKEILVNSSLKVTKKKKLARLSQKFRWTIQGHLSPLVSITP